MTTSSHLPVIGFIGLGVMGRPVASHLAVAIERYGHCSMAWARRSSISARSAQATLARSVAPDASVSGPARWIERLTHTEITPGATPAAAKA